MSRAQEMAQWVARFTPPKVWELMVAVHSARRGRSKFGPRYHEHLNGLRVTQWYGDEEITALQEHLLRGMVHYAAAHVPYWRELFLDLGLRPADIQTAADLTKLPVLEKSTIRANPTAFRSELYPEGSSDIEHFRTSGTTGEALRVTVTLDCLKLEKAFTWLHRGWAGVELGDRVAAFIGYPVVPRGRSRPPFWVHDRVEDRLLFSLHHMSQENLAAYADALERFRPRAIVGYPTAIYLMALWLQENGRTAVRADAVFTASETLLPTYRSTIEAAFGCTVFDWYGTSELIGNITQCELGSYHVKQEYAVVELLGPDGHAVGTGEPGHVIGTGLNNHAMPLFRYRVGDMAVPREGRCACGRAGRLVEEIVGRTEDVIVTPEGRYITRLDFIFKTIEAVREAQLVQERVDHLRVRVVPGPGFGAAEEDRIRSNLRERLGDGIRIDVERVEAIPRLASGKFRYVISKVPLELAGARQVGDALGLSAEEDATL